MNTHLFVSMFTGFALQPQMLASDGNGNKLSVECMIKDDSGSVVPLYKVTNNDIKLNICFNKLDDAIQYYNNLLLKTIYVRTSRGVGIVKNRLLDTLLVIQPRFPDEENIDNELLVLNSDQVIEITKEEYDKEII